MKTAIDTQF